MRNIRKLVVLAAFLVTLTGCESNDYVSEETEQVDGGRFLVIYRDEKGLENNRIVIDKETRVEYFFHYYGYGGGMTVLLDNDGKSIIYEGD